MAKIELTDKIVQDVLQQDIKNICLLKTICDFNSDKYYNELKDIPNIQTIIGLMQYFTRIFNRKISSNHSNILAGLAVMQTEKANIPCGVLEFMKSPVYSEKGNYIVGRAISYNKNTKKFESTPNGWFTVGTLELSDNILSMGMFYFLDILTTDYSCKRFINGYER